VLPLDGDGVRRRPAGGAAEESMPLFCTSEIRSLEGSKVLMEVAATSDRDPTDAHATKLRAEGARADA
jgi:hypothetical protein